MTEEKIQQADVHLAAPGSLSALRAATVGQPLWIPVAERLPEPGTDCLVWHREYAPGFGRYAKVDRWDEQHESPVGWSSATIPVGPGWSDSDFDDVTHWMPLPGAPTGQSQTFDAGEATCASNEPDEQDTDSLPLPQPTGERNG